MMRCPACGQENPDDARFCAYCGRTLQAADRPGEERRLISVLFSDVAGSTSLGEALDPEDLRVLLARYYTIAREVVGAFGGTLEKFIGDAVVAVFGLPQAHGDDAQRALAAALELRDRVHADPTLGERLPIRVGVNTGEVLAHPDRASGDFLLAGDAVNVAARLQQTADPWAIVAGERTVRAAGEAFTFGPALAVDARGKASPVRAFRLVGHKPESRRQRIPLVGRAADLAQLELVARRVLDEQRPYLVSIIAPAGTGKTRLVEEFLERLPGLAPHTSVATAQCLPYGQRLTYWPLRAVLFRLVGIPDDAGPEAIRTAVQAWTKDAGVEEGNQVADLLAATVGAADPEVIDREGLFAAWRTAVEAASRRRPLVLIFEDLHWSSDTLLDLVEFVMQPRGDSSVLMLALTRPELLDRRPAWGGGRRNYISLALQPLPDTAVADLVMHLLGGQAPGIVTHVVARAEGNPFYAGEIVRSIQDRVASMEDIADVERAVATLPDTVQATVLARLDLLSAPERRILQVGAVFGRSFRPNGITTVEPGLRGEVTQLLERLVDRDLLRPADGDRLTFRHILIREVAYQTLPRTERARLHAAAGQWLEQRAGGREDVLAELVAYHYREAVQTPTAGQDPGSVALLRSKAVQWLSRAAAVTQAAAANLETARHLRSAIDLAEPPDLPDLYERLGDTLVEGDACQAAYRKALELSRQAGRPPDDQLRILGSLLMLLMRSSGFVSQRPEPEDLEGLRRQGQDLLPEAISKASMARFLAADSFWPWWLRNSQRPVPPQLYAVAQASAEQAVLLAEEIDAPDLLSSALDGLASLALQRGDLHEAREVNRRRLAFQHRLNLLERLDAHSMVAWESLLLGDLGEAEEVTRSGVAIAQPGQLPAAVLHVTAWRSYALTLRGKWPEALAAGDRALQLWIEAARPTAGYVVRMLLGALDVARARQDASRIEQYNEFLEDVIRRVPPVSVTARMGFYVRLELDALQEEAEQLRLAYTGTPEYLERLLSLLTDFQRPPSPERLRAIIEFSGNRLVLLEAQARRALGMALRDVDEVGAALAMFERCGAVPYAARARIERAHLTRDAREMNSGTKVLENLGDVDYLERLSQPA